MFRLTSCLAVVVVLVGVRLVSAETIDLISLVDLDRDVVHGEWELDGDKLVYSGSAARLSFPYRPPLEYDYTVEFSITSGSNPWDNLAQLVSHGEVPFTWSTNAGTGHSCRLEDINGHSVIGNPTMTPYQFVGSLNNGRRYTSVVRVRDDRVVCEINGATLVDYETDYSDLSRNGKWTMPDQLNIGLGGFSSGTRVYSATITVVPEPSTFILLFISVLGLIAYRRRRLLRR